VAGSRLEQEIREQPEALQRLLQEGREAVEGVAQALRRRASRLLVIVARGSSDNAARYGQYLFGGLNRLPVALATPSLVTLYESPPRLDEAAVLAISQSGQSPDIVAFAEEGRRQGALTVALTNDPSSPLAGVCHHTLCLYAGEERSVAATKTYTNSLLALAMLSVAMDGDEDRWEILRRLPAWLSQTLELAPEVARAAERYRYAEACVVVSRGYNYGTAFEIALKLKELAYLVAEPYSSADFRHGPVALVERGFPVILIVPEGRVTAELVDLARQLKAREAELVLISPVEEALGLAQTSFALPTGVPEWVSPVITVVPGQLLALGLAQAKGLDPDRPRGLQKVTRTR